MCSDTDKMNIREIAKIAQVSTATVSRVLRNPEKVRPATLKKVMEVVDACSYTPRRITPSSSNVILFFQNEVGNTFYNEVLRSLTEYAKEDGYFVMTCSSNHHYDLECKMFEYGKRLGCAGIVLTGLSEIKKIQSQTPVVVLDASDMIQGDFYRISSDNAMAIQMLVEHLLRLNHTKIGFISGGDKNTAGIIRENFFMEMMKRKNKKVNSSSIFKGRFDIKSGIEAFDYFYSLPEIPTAIISANDEMAKGFIIRANSFGVKIPEDISICGIDAIDTNSFLPRITSIKQDVDGTALEIYEFIKKHKVNPPANFKIFPVTFSYGNSTYKRIDS